ncbi:MAG: GxxExxY protein [Pedobacter sp.]|jgi:GxxExxY protein|uniref:GxxExxY protein n=1 Tax=Pedobacter sp. TaxID=1411316 RepID=UPI003566F1AA
MIYNTEEYPYQEETYDLIGIAMEIHRVLGKGFLEVVYKDALEYELIERGIRYEREKEYSINYKGVTLPHKFYADFVIDSKIILEIKSKLGVIEEHYAQVLNYLAISKLQVGLIINFHERSLQHKRVVLTK